MAGVAPDRPPVIMPGFVAAADLSAKQYHIALYSAANKLTVASAATDLMVGVIYNEPYTGEPIELVPPGQVCLMIVDGNAGAIVPGTRLTSDASGHGIATVTNLDRVIAIALDNSSAAGDVICVALIPSDVSL